VVTEILHLESGAAQYHVGTYSAFYAIHQRNTSVADEPRAKPRPSIKQTVRRPERAVNVRERKPEEIEQEIQTLESELSMLAEQLSNPAPDWTPQQYAEIDARQQEITGKLDRLYREWETRATIKERPPSQ
jgi:hypothetical protein